MKNFSFSFLKSQKRLLFLTFWLSSASASHAFNTLSFQEEWTRPSLTQYSAFSVSIFNDNFLSESQLPGQENVYQNISFRYEKRGLNYAMDLGLNFVPQDKLFPYLIIPNAYKTFLYPQSSVDLGRKQEVWSTTDHYQKIGLWEPQTIYDLFSPIPNGFTGVFWNKKTSQWRTVLFGSVIFIPSIFPHFDFNTNQFSTSNRWFRVPPEQIELLPNEFISLEYSLEQPDLIDILNQWSVAGLFEGKINRDWTFQVAYARKPMNSLHVTLPEISISLGSQAVGNVSIKPTFLYHDLLTLELRGKTSNQQWVLNWTYNNPHVPPLKRSGDIRVVRDQSRVFRTQSLSGLFSYKFSKIKDLEMFFSFNSTIKKTKISEHDAIISETLGSILQNYLEQTTKFQDFVVAGLKVRISPRWTNHFQYFYAYGDNGGLLQNSLRYEFDSNLHCYLNLDIIGEEEDSDSVIPTFFTKYRNNDKVSLGVKYVF